MRTRLPLLLALAAWPQLAGAAPAAADLGVARTVVRARLAGILGREDRQAVLLSEAAADAPGDGRLATTALRSAILAGDASLAGQLLARLPASAPRSPDILLFAFVEALRSGDKAGQQAALARVAGDPALAFLAPTFRAWLAIGSGDAAPAQVPVFARAEPDADRVETRGLILAAGRRVRDAMALLPALLAPADPQAGAREVRLRVALALAAARAGDATDAQKLAGGSDPALARTREALARGQSTGDAIDTPARGVADRLDILAAELSRGRPPAIALAVARLATVLSPDQARPWLVLASLDALGDSPADGVAALANVPAASAFAPAARTLRIRLLVSAGDLAGAMRAAETATAARDAGADDWTALGEAQAAGGDNRAAAASFMRARRASNEAGAPEASLWRYDLMAGNALVEAGDWHAAEPLLARAARLAPDEPEALNDLGFARIDHHEDVAAATRMIERAHALDPESGAITDSLGWAKVLEGDIAGAIPLLEHAVAAEPGDPEINEHLGDAYWAAGRLFEARYAWRAASVYADAAVKARLAAKIESGRPAT